MYRPAIFTRISAPLFFEPTRDALGDDPTSRVPSFRFPGAKWNMPTHPSALRHPRSPTAASSLAWSHTRQLRAPTSLRSTGFCVPSGVVLVQVRVQSASVPSAKARSRSWLFRTLTQHQQQRIHLDLGLVDLCAAVGDLVRVALPFRAGLGHPFGRPAAAAAPPPPPPPPPPAELPPTPPARLPWPLWARSGRKLAPL